MLLFNQENGFTLFEIVMLFTIVAVLFSFGAPKYVECIQETHNANIDIMVSNIRIWSSEQAIENLHHEGSMRYPIPNSVKIDSVIKEGNTVKWDDSNSDNWEYIAGGGIQLVGDGTYLDVIPIYMN